MILRYATVFCFYKKVMFRRQEGTFLADNVIRTDKTSNEFECGAICSKESTCVSINYKKSGSDKGKCELNNKLMEDSEANRRMDREYDYLELVSDAVVSLFMQVNCLNDFFDGSFDLSF